MASAHPAVAVSRAHLEEIAGRARPVALAGERVLPVAPALEPLLPERGLRRGSVVTVLGSTSLALALTAAASEAGSWCAAAVSPSPTTHPSVGLLAAAELGIALERFPLAVVPPGRFSWVVAALLDAFEVVLAWPPGHLRPPEARRLASRGRERGSALVVCGPGWPEMTDLRLSVEGAVWRGIGRGHGRLEARQVEVSAVGRGAARRERRVRLWLPSPDGRVAAVFPGAQAHPGGGSGSGEATG